MRLFASCVGLVALACGATRPEVLGLRPPAREAVVGQPDAGATLSRASIEQTLLAESLDGVWELLESCDGAPITYSLTIKGARGQLATTSREGTSAEDVALVDDEAQVLVSPVDDPRSPLFGLQRQGAVLSRSKEGSFEPRCTSFVRFIERTEVRRQGWSAIRLGSFSVSYPTSVFGNSWRRRDSLELGAPTVFASDMGGQRVTFSVRLSLVPQAPSAVLGKVIASNWPDESEDGPMIAGRRGVELTMGIEGVSTNHLAVRMKNGQTLAARIDWVDAFANPKLTMPSTMQLAIAERILASVDDGYR